MFSTSEWPSGLDTLFLDNRVLNHIYRGGLGGYCVNSKEHRQTLYNLLNRNSEHEQALMLLGLNVPSREAPAYESVVRDKGPGELTRAAAQI